MAIHGVIDVDAQRQSETPDQAGPVHIELEG
jgi:hypothetical protein